MAEKVYKLSEKQFKVLSETSKRLNEAQKEVNRLREVQAATFALVLDFLGLPDNTNGALNEETRELTVIEPEAPPAEPPKTE